MNTIDAPRRIGLALALALAWIPAAMMAAPRAPLRLDPVVVSVEAPAPEAPAQEQGPAQLEA